MAFWLEASLLELEFGTLFRNLSRLVIRHSDCDFFMNERSKLGFFRTISCSMTLLGLCSRSSLEIDVELEPNESELELWLKLWLELWLKLWLKLWIELGSKIGLYIGLVKFELSNTDFSDCFTPVFSFFTGFFTILFEFFELLDFVHFLVLSEVSIF